MFSAVRACHFIALSAVLLLLGSFDQVQAQTPSNTCAHERTECLRARVQKGILGSEYVPSDDTARCQAAYQACLAGQQNSQPAPRSSTSPNAPGGSGGQQGVLPDPKAAATSTQKKAKLPPSTRSTGNVLAGVRKFNIGKMEWEINAGVATYRQVYPGAATSVVTARGTVSSNRIEGTMEWTFPGDPCHIRQTEHFVYVFDAENVSGLNQPGPVEVRGSCKGWDKMTRGSSFTSPWRKTE